MSGAATVWAWQQSVANPVRKLILLHMADSVSVENGWQSWYSLARIAERCDCSRGSVRNHLKALVDSGFLTLIEASTRQGRAARYRLNIGVLKSETSTEGGTPDVQQHGQNKLKGGASDVQLNNQILKKGGATVTHGGATGKQGGTPDTQLGGTPDVQGGTRDVQGVHLVNEGGTRDVPKPSIEPSINQKETKDDSVSFSWMKYFAEQHGYRVDLFSAIDRDKFDQWIEMEVTRDEVFEAHRIGVVNLGTDYPGIGYLHGVINNTRKDDAKKLVKKPPTKQFRQVESTDVLDDPEVQKRYQLSADRELAEKLRAQGLPVPEALEGVT